MICNDQRILQLGRSFEKLRERDDRTTAGIEGRTPSLTLWEGGRPAYTRGIAIHCFVLTSPAG